MPLLKKYNKKTKGEESLEKTAAPLKKTRAPRHSKKTSSTKGSYIDLERFEGNPVIVPNPNHNWESKATFNPGAFSDKNRVYLLYRAIGDNDVSVIGFASSENGLSVNQKGEEPIFTHTKPKPNLTDIATPRINYLSGGGWNGGAEDPRLTVLENNLYMIYTAFDGWGSLRIALTSIPLKDFRKKKWNWSKPILISPPGEINKNWVLFPEKIKGKFAILHSITPNILIDYFNDLKEFNGSKYIHSRSGSDPTRKNKWDNWVRGAGPPPMKTKLGWLLLYHAMDKRDPNRYKLGAMLLDLKDPTKILYRTVEPILEPDEIYENEGFKAGVVYACGAVIINETLFVYYGGADAVSCVATAPLEEFLKELRATGKTKLKKTKVMPNHV